MKKINILAFVLVVLAIGSTTARAETFYAYLSSAQEVPTNASAATGYARIVVNESTLTINYTIVFNGLQGAQSGAHIHAPAAIGANTGVAIGFPNVGGTSGTITGSTAITATQISQIRAHLGYVNVHSATFPGGEIRGQLGIKRPVDFDGDGRQDLSVLRFPNVAPPGVSQITYWNRTTTSGDQTVAWGDANTDFPVPGDYDGDGRDDLALYRDGTVAEPQSKFYILRSSDSTAFIPGFGLNGDQAICRDYDGDGTTDIAIFRRGAAPGDQAFWWIRRSSSPANFAVVGFGTTGATDGSTGDTPIPGDYDGDGKFDIAVYRFGGLSPNNRYIILRSSDFAVTYREFGNFQTDYILPGDYDGDGKYDLAIARTGATGTSPLVWWILNSSTGFTSTMTFGISSDLPVQGDYDGDARTDRAIYRRGATAGAQSNFWVFNSFTNSASVLPWGLGADFPVATFDAR
ncbi:MAG: CHRD domain-containing protein [Pyrinomonadaceae bacterium]